jgi:uncharacterized metal-binding protein
LHGRDSYKCRQGALTEREETCEPREEKPVLNSDFRALKGYVIGHDILCDSTVTYSKYLLE